MSWARLSPSPVLWPVSLVVKNGLNIFCMTSGVMPGPLSLTVIVTLSGVPKVLTISSGVYVPLSSLAFSAIAWQALVTRLAITLAMSSVASSG